MPFSYIIIFYLVFIYFTITLCYFYCIV